MTTKRRRRSLAGLGRLRVSLKRAHNVLDLIVPELDAWRSRILELEGRDRADYIALETGAEAEADALASAAWAA